MARATCLSEETSSLPECALLRTAATCLTSRRTDELDLRRRTSVCRYHEDTKSLTNFLCTYRMSCSSRMMIILGLACCIIVEKCWAATLPTREDLNDENSLRMQRQLRSRNVLSSADWVKITTSPDAMITTQIGDRMVLECEAVGSPAPRIHWVRGLSLLSQDEGEYEDNHIRDDPGMATAQLARVRSRLVIDCVLPQNEQPYTCVATSGGQTAMAAPAMLLIEKRNANNLTALLSACPISKASAATITSWIPSMINENGADIILPCRAQGKPRPQVYWLDADSHLIDNSQPRYKVLPNGDLLIQQLEWSDMGTYICVATNTHSRDTAPTFLYPARMEER